MVPMTVPDVFELRADPARLAGAAAALRALAASLEAGAGALGHGRAGLDRLLDRVEVPSLYGAGTLTFFPHDEADFAGIDNALRAAVRLRHALARELGCTCARPSEPGDRQLSPRPAGSP
jgi:hypothetical protein